MNLRNIVGRISALDKTLSPDLSFRQILNPVYKKISTGIKNHKNFYFLAKIFETAADKDLIIEEYLVTAFLELCFFCFYTISLSPT